MKMKGLQSNIKEKVTRKISPSSSSSISISWFRYSNYIREYLALVVICYVMI